MQKNVVKLLKTVKEKFYEFNIRSISTKNNLLKLIFINNNRNINIFLIVLFIARFLFKSSLILIKRLLLNEKIRLI